VATQFSSVAPGESFAGTEKVCHPMLVETRLQAAREAHWRQAA
jgi:hypothetical protein